MLSKAHLACGLALGFTLFSPGTPEEAIPVIAGAAAGSLICDIDTEGASEKADASRWRKAGLGIILLAFLADHLTGGSFVRTAAVHWPYLWFAGLAVFLITCSFASVSSHRGFSHSLAALALEAGSVWLMFPPAAMPFAAAFISHILLDILNKKPVRLLYPVKRGFCLGMFYADRLADKICTAAGTLWLLLEIFRCAKG